MHTDSRTAQRPDVVWLCPGLRTARAVLGDEAVPSDVRPTDPSSVRLSGNLDDAAVSVVPPRTALLECLSVPAIPTRAAASSEQSLLQLLCAEADAATASLPGAVCRLLGESGERLDAPLVCADPVNFRADRDSARVTPGEALAIDAADADALIDALNALVGGDGLQFSRRSNTAGWYLQGMTGEALACLPTASVAYRNIDQYPPPLTDGKRWRQLMSEVQMLLHAHEVNATRAARKLAPINGLWFWGGGRPPVGSLPGSDSSLQVVPLLLYADDAFARGLARFAGVPCKPSSDTALTADCLSGDSGTATRVFMDTTVRDALLVADVDALEQALDHLAIARLAPFQQWLDEGRVGSVRIDAGDSLSVSLIARKRPLWSRLLGRLERRST